VIEEGFKLRQKTLIVGINAIFVFYDIAFGFEGEFVAAVARASVRTTFSTPRSA